MPNIPPIATLVQWRVKSLRFALFYEIFMPPYGQRPQRQAEYCTPGATNGEPLRLLPPPGIKAVPRRQRMRGNVTPDTN
jgi:hypothetical protein